MYLRVRCPECDVGLRLRPEDLGTRKRCPRCRGDVEFDRDDMSAGRPPSPANVAGGRAKRGGIVAVVSVVAVVVGIALAFRIPSWSSHREEERIRALLESVFESLGANEQGHQEYRHTETGIIFVRLPGGTFEMGTSEEEARTIVDELMLLKREEYRELETWTEEKRRRIVGIMREYDLAYQIPQWDAERVRVEIEESVAHEAPRHGVTLSPFLISKYEVSQEQWQRVMGDEPTSSWFKGRGLPVVDVDWIDCQRFCERTGLHLPTEAQWEYACRGGTESLYSFGDEMTLERARFHDSPGGEWIPIVLGESSRGLVPVDSSSPNPFGLHHMHGNAEEWCQDVYDPAFYRRSDSGQPDPCCSDGSPVVVRRGGGCLSHRLSCRSASRRPVDILETRLVVGFRPVFHLAEAEAVPKPEASITGAVERYDDAFGRDPAAGILIAKARVLRKLDRVDESDVLYRRGAKLAPSPKRLWLEYGEELIGEERHDEAIACFDHAIDASDEFAAAWRAKAELLEYLKRKSEALECYERLTEIDRSDTESWCRQGWILVRLGRHREAVRRFDRAIESDEGWGGGWYGKGAAMWRADGRSEDAVRALERAAVLGHVKARAYLQKIRSRS